MSKILIATDFSEVAQQATAYGCQLGATYDLSVHLVHAHMIPIAFSDTPVPILPLDEMRQIAEENMQDTLVKLKADFPLLSLSGECFLGDTIDVLKDCSKQMLPLLTILGNSGSAEDGAWLGSTVLNGMRQLPCPVLAVPPGYAFRHIQTICLACDDDDLEKGSEMNSLLRLQQQLNAALELVYVRKDDAAAPDYNSSKLKAALDNQTVALHEIQNPDIAAGVHEAAVAMNADWLAVVPHRHNFFTGLFHKSQTKAILHESELPVLALPQGS